MEDIVGWVGNALVIISYLYLAKTNDTKSFVEIQTIACVCMLCYAVLLNNRVYEVLNIFILCTLIINLIKGRKQ